MVELKKQLKEQQNENEKLAANINRMNVDFLRQTKSNDMLNE